MTTVRVSGVGVISADNDEKLHATALGDIEYQSLINFGSTGIRAEIHSTHAKVLRENLIWEKRRYESRPSPSEAFTQLLLSLQWLDAGFVRHEPRGVSDAKSRGFSGIGHLDFDSELSALLIESEWHVSDRDSHANPSSIAYDEGLPRGFGGAFGAVGSDPCRLVSATQIANLDVRDDNQRASEQRQKEVIDGYGVVSRPFPEAVKLGILGAFFVGLCGGAFVLWCLAVLR
ncbi:MAG TPA: hypothetical protein VLX09_24085 [Stellaceae bacterium]|nr:hypothetical protein [Stellaceae bacterium]